MSCILTSVAEPLSPSRSHMENIFKSVFADWSKSIEVCGG